MTTECSNSSPIEGLLLEGIRFSLMQQSTGLLRPTSTPFGCARSELVSNQLESKIPSPKGDGIFGASSGIRTPDTLLKRQVLYLLS